MTWACCAALSKVKFDDLRNLEGVSDAVVVKKRDAKWGEVPVAFVVAEASDLSAQDFLAALDGKIARYKLPKEIITIHPDEIERNPTGKIRRDLLEIRANAPKQET